MVRRLLLLNGLAVLGAVVNHSSGWGFTAMFWWTDRYLSGSVPDFSQLGSASYYVLRGMEQAIMFSIPAFLFVSGFFMAFATGRNRDTVDWRVVGSRIKTLLIPYLLWSVALFFWKGLDGWVGTPVDYLKELLLGRAAPPYYYIPLVFQFYLLSPLILPLVKKRWKPVLLGAAALQFLVLLARYPVILGWDLPAASWIVRMTPGFTIFQACFWFAFGIFAGFHLDILKAWVSRWRRLWPVFTVFFGLAAFVEWEVLFRLSNSDWLPPGVSILDSLYAGAVILTFLCFDQSVLPFESFWADLGAKSFGVYLMHAPVLQFVSRAVYNVAPWVLGYQIIFQPMLLIAGIAIPLLVMIAFNRSPARPYYRYVFG